MTETVTSYEDKTIEQLKDELRRRDLPVSGSKAELVDRLEEDDAAFKDAPAAAADDEPKTTDSTQAEAAAVLKPGEQMEVAPGQFLTGVGASTEPVECVVDAEYHVGRAVPGTKVCSYHTMHYLADGTPRGE